MLRQMSARLRAETGKEVKSEVQLKIRSKKKNFFRNEVNRETFFEKIFFSKCGKGEPGKRIEKNFFRSEAGERGSFFAPLHSSPYCRINNNVSKPPTRAKPTQAVAHLAPSVSVPRRRNKDDVVCYGVEWNGAHKRFHVRPGLSEPLSPEVHFPFNY